MRETLASRLGFILLSAGCAIGIGNVWRFPYVVGESGGGWFIPLYLLALLALGLPVLVMEFAVGRASRRSLVSAHAALTPGCRLWGLHGLAGLVGNVFLMMFYTTVAGWMLIYFCKTLAGDFVGLTPEGIGAAFGGVLADPWLQTAYMAGVCLGSAAVCLVGLRQGLERVSKVMMLALFVLIVVLAANSILQKGASEGLKFYLVPDWERLCRKGIVTVVVSAMNQAFFTLSLGIGAMTIFGSYIGRDRTLPGEAFHVAVLDTLVAVCAGLIVIPACFAYGIEPGQGPGLIFVTLPNVFNHMSGGRLWGAAFFLFMSFAALTTVLAVFECIIAGLMDALGWSRRRAGLAVALAMPFLSLPCVFGFNLWSSFRPFGGSSNVLDLEDFVVSDLLLPAGSVAFALYCCHRFGWGWPRFREEANAGEGPKLPNGLRLYCAYAVPAVVAVIFVLGLCRRFG